MRKFLLLVVAALTVGVGCNGFLSGSGSGSASASLSFKAEINIPLAKMPPKYASWVVESQGYLAAVTEAYKRHVAARGALAAALGVANTADAIATFIRNTIQVSTRMTCTPPSFSASFVGDCRAKANARASGSAGGGQASGEAAAGIQANCQASASLSLSPGSCTIKTTTTKHPILSDAARWAKVESNMKIILQLAAANKHLSGRGDGINSRGLKLYVEAVTDLAKDITLALKLGEIRKELKRGSEAASAADKRQSAMNSDLDTMTAAINAKFPDLSASIATN